MFELRVQRHEDEAMSMVAVIGRFTNSKDADKALREVSRFFCEMETKHSCFRCLVCSWQSRNPSATAADLRVFSAQVLKDLGMSEDDGDSAWCDYSYDVYVREVAGSKPVLDDWRSIYWTNLNWNRVELWSDDWAHMCK